MCEGSRISAFQRLRTDRRGAILPMAAVMAIIMFLLAGLAIDVALIISAKNRVRRAMDAAGIAIATNFRDNETATQEDVEAFTVKWMESNYPSYKIGEFFDLNVVWVDGVADLSAKVRVDTLFMDLAGATEIDAGVSIRVISETRGLEVALALDNSGSMLGSKLDYLRAGVNRFMKVLHDNATEPETIKVALVPFVTAVNIKNAETFPNWLNPVDKDDVLFLDDNDDAEAPDVPHHGENFTPRTSHAYLYKQYATAAGQLRWHDAWRGCVEARAINYNGKDLDLTDVEPDPAYPKTLWVPYFWPDEPDTALDASTDHDAGKLLIGPDNSLPTTDSNGDHWVRNDYINDLVPDETMTFMERLESILKYTDPTNAEDAVKKSDDTPPITRGPSKSCPNPMIPLTPLTDENFNDLSTLVLNRNQDEYLSGWNEGGTNIPQGLVWAWRALSKNKPFTEGADYLDDKGNVNKSVEKIIVLFVDGGNGIVYEPSPIYSDYSAYNYLVPDGRLATDNLNEKLLKLCNNVRAPAGQTSQEKIVIYTVAFKITDLDERNAVLNILEQCAGNAEQVFYADSDYELFAVFESLAEELTRLRVVY